MIPGLYAMVGAAAVLGGVTRMTGNYRIFIICVQKTGFITITYNPRPNLLFVVLCVVHTYIPIFEG